jgi:hypothetical protein
MARAGRAFYPSIGAPTHKADIHAAWLPTNDWKPSQPRTSPIRWFRIRSYIPSRRTLQPPQSLNIGTRSSAQHDKGEMVMSKILVLGAAALALSAAAASAQTYMTPGYGYAPYGYGYAATAPLYDYAAPAYGYAAPAFGYEYGGTPPAIAQNPPPSGGYPPPAAGAAGNPATYAPPGTGTIQGAPIQGAAIQGAPGPSFQSTAPSPLYLQSTGSAPSARSGSTDRASRAPR